MIIKKNRLFSIVLIFVLLLSMLAEMNLMTYADDVIKYGLWIGESAQVTSENLSGTGWRFEPATNTLTLTNYSFIATDNDFINMGIWYERDSELNIVLQGENVLISNVTGIQSSGPIVIREGSGGGTLEAEGKMFQGICPSNGLTIESGTINLNGNYGAISSVGRMAVTITGGKVTANGGIYASDGMIINGGEVYVTSEKDNTYGFSGGDLSIGRNISVFIISGSKGAIDHSVSVKNEISGTGWSDKAGTEGKTDIAISTSGQSLEKYKKVQFPKASVDVSEVSLNKTSISLNVGDTETLEATVKPADAKNNTIIWSSDNERVVTVNNDGVVTAVSPGTASITAAATNGTESASDDKNATCTVTVNKLNSTITKAPEGKVLAYTGSAQELVTAGTTDDGTIYFALGTDDKTAPTMGYSTSIPTGIEAGTYYVWYKVFGDEKHNDTNPVCIAVTIGKTGTEKPTEPTPVNITRDAFTGVNETVRILANGTAVVKSVEDNGRNTLKVTGTVKQNGKTYAVSRFATNSFSDVDATTITIDLTASEDEQRVTFASRAFEESGAEKLKLRLTSASWVKFKSGAFSGSDIKKVLIYGLDQAGFKKIQKKMRAAGYKGKIVKM